MVQNASVASKSVDHLSIFTILTRDSSPKPGIPSPEAYRPPSPPSQRDLGPPPPGWGRFNDHGAGQGGPSGGFVVGPNNPGSRRNLDDVLCFKVSYSSNMGLC
jgi:hypothetical protein